MPAKSHCGSAETEKRSIGKQVASLGWDNVNDMQSSSCSARNLTSRLSPLPRHADKKDYCHSVAQDRLPKADV